MTTATEIDIDGLGYLLRPANQLHQARRALRQLRSLCDRVAGGAQGADPQPEPTSRSTRRVFDGKSEVRRRDRIGYLGRPKHCRRLPFAQFFGRQESIQARQCLRHDTALGLNVLDDLHRRAVIHLGDRVRVDRFEVEYLRINAGCFQFQVARSNVLAVAAVARALKTSRATVMRVRDAQAA